MVVGLDGDVDAPRGCVPRRHRGRGLARSVCGVGAQVFVFEFSQGEIGVSDEARPFDLRCVGVGDVGGAGSVGVVGVDQEPHMFLYGSLAVRMGR